MSLVLDASVTIAWIIPDERTDEVRAVFERIISTSAWVPSLWRLEVANVMEMGVRRGQIEASFRDDSLRDVALLPVSLDLETYDRPGPRRRGLPRGTGLRSTTQPISNWRCDAGCRSPCWIRS